MTKITLETNYGIYSISLPQDDMDMGNLMDNLIVPLILSAGYAEDTIKQYVDTAFYPMIQEESE